MSYNISSWKTKKMENLVIPVDSFYKHKRTDWHPGHPVIINSETMEVEMECGIEQSIKGILKDGMIHVTELEMDGEGSGTFRSFILDGALKESKGEMEAVLIWEGGDSITKLTVKDGVLEEIKIDL